MSASGYKDKIERKKVPGAFQKLKGCKLGYPVWSQKKVRYFAATQGNLCKPFLANGGLGRWKLQASKKTAELQAPEDFFPWNHWMILWLLANLCKSSSIENFHWDFPKKTVGRSKSVHNMEKLGEKKTTSQSYFANPNLTKHLIWWQLGRWKQIVQVKLKHLKQLRFLHHQIPATVFLKLLNVKNNIVQPVNSAIFTCWKMCSTTSLIGEPQVDVSKLLLLVPATAKQKMCD